MNQKDSVDLIVRFAATISLQRQPYIRTKEMIVSHSQKLCTTVKCLVEIFYCDFFKRTKKLLIKINYSSLNR